MFKKTGGAPKNLRKRELEPGAEDDTKVTKAITAAVAGISSSSTDTSVKGMSTTAVLFTSDRSAAAQVYAGDAFSTNEIDTEVSRDAQSILERNIALKKAGIGGEEGGAKLYVGSAAYKTFTKADELTVEQARASMKAKGTQGPLRAPTFIRTTAVFDYQPDVCKDYKETGFCGFGDSCLYMHDRSDYKTGWQQEKEWDEQQAKKKKRLEEASALSAFATAGGADVNGFAYAGDSEAMLKLYANSQQEAALERDEAIVGHKVNDYTKGMPSQMQQIQKVKSSSSKESQEDESLPFACFICRHPFTSPVATNCGHYFCSACIMAANKKSSKCPVCKKHTGGVFNVAHKILAKMKQ